MSCLHNYILYMNISPVSSKPGDSGILLPEHQSQLSGGLPLEEDCHRWSTARSLPECLELPHPTSGTPGSLGCRQCPGRKGGDSITQQRRECGGNYIEHDRKWNTTQLKRKSLFTLSQLHCIPTASLLAWIRAILYQQTLRLVTSVC